MILELLRTSSDEHFLSILLFCEQAWPAASESLMLLKDGVPGYLLVRKVISLARTPYE